jgi:hypothetical protein
MTGLFILFVLAIILGEMLSGYCKELDRKEAL